jgi:hypothetical protein
VCASVMKTKNKPPFCLLSHEKTVPTADNADERIQRRSTVRLGIRLLHKICPEINFTSSEPSPPQQPTVPRSLRLRLSPKARKLIKQTSLIIHGSNSNSNTNNNSNGTVKSIETDVTDGLNKVSRFADNEGQWSALIRKERRSSWCTLTHKRVFSINKSEVTQIKALPLSRTLVDSGVA